VAVRVVVEDCHELYNRGKRPDIFELDFELELVSVLVVSATELAGKLKGESTIRSDDLSEKVYNLFLGNLSCWGRTGDPNNGN
jgi:hypothetical protein